MLYLSRSGKQGEPHKRARASAGECAIRLRAIVQADHLSSYRKGKPEKDR